MRPIDKNDLDSESVEDNNIARNKLNEVIGRMCSYCEMRIDNMGEREHIEATSQGGNPTSLKNNLLACKYCNTRKNDKITSRAQCIWPDENNTLLAYKYLDDGQVVVALPSSHPAYEKALNLWSACNLNNIPKVNEADQRLRSRLEAWTKAVNAYFDWSEYYKNAEKDEQYWAYIRGLGSTASGNGFFSVWFTVFQDDIDVINELIKAFPGTCKACFNESGKPISRIDGFI